MMTFDYFTLPSHYGRFDALNMNKNCLLNLAYSLYEHLELIKIKIKKVNFKNFINLVEKNYTSTSYHNFAHAIDVVCSTLYLIKKSKFQLTHIEKIGIVFGALLHDVGHYGRTGKYVSTYDKQKYEKFGKNSTLEKYHLNLGFDLIKKTKLFDELTINFTTKLKKIIKCVILATDPTIKLNNLSIFHPYALIIRCADISSVHKIFSIHRKWSYALMNEFYLEGNELQTKHNVKKLEPMFDIAEKKHFHKKQQDFFTFYAEPHFDKLKLYVNNYNELWDKIKTNKEKWNT